MFELVPLGLPGAFELRGRLFKDERGEFRKTVHKDFFEEHKLEWRFAEQFFTISNKNVLRGMHFQTPPHDHEKLVSCISGEALDVLVDLRKSSPTYGQCVSLRLSAEKATSAYIPRGIAHGFLSLKDETALMYSVTACHAPNSDTGILWSSIPFDWGIKTPILSERDQSFQKLEAYRSPFQ